MKNLNITLLISTIFIIISLLFVLPVKAQVSVHHVTGETNVNDKQGIFYSLPRTLMKVDVVVKKIEYYAGPYAEYAGKYLDIDDAITSDYNEYKITDAKLSAISEPDPDQYYFLEIDEKAVKENKSLIFSLSGSGLIMGLGGYPTDMANKELLSACSFEFVISINC